ncbi:MAG: HD domain-containing protein [Oscillospiraceae bacterium]|nr:HD domain-containing protein [Oscillospiraceae bacterium]
MVINLPFDVTYIIDTLEKNGFEAYAVGGCVRDSLRKEIPDDWDVCTSALPGQTAQIFKKHHIIETGLKHGTITLMLRHKPFEITTYRVDGKYKDNRRPETVRFVDVLKRDLARRDFTVNAMAYNPKTGIVDYYGGALDIAEKRIKCVGNPDKRFKEDALRIMRALRFAAVLGYDIEENTANTMIKNRGLLKNIASERISAELNKLLLADNIRRLLAAHLPVLTEILPELEPLIGFEQNSVYHAFDVMEHTLRSVEAAPKDLTIRLAMLFHDIAKPGCYKLSEKGASSFRGHEGVSADMSREILNRLRYDKETSKIVTGLVLCHGIDLDPNHRSVKRWLGKLGETQLRRLLLVKKADNAAKSEHFREKFPDNTAIISTLIDIIIEQQQCFSLKDLAVNGKDLIAAGITDGAQIGKTLNALLEMVVDEKIENDKEKLLKALQESPRFDIDPPPVYN